MNYTCPHCAHVFDEDVCNCRPDLIMHECGPYIECPKCNDEFPKPAPVATQIRPVTVETEVWVNHPDKPGYLQFSHSKTILDWSNEVTEAFKKLNPLEQKYGHGEFEWFGLSSRFTWAGFTHRKDGFTAASPLPRNAKLTVYCEQGGSEGYIVRIDLQPDDEPAVNLICGKCFDREYAWKATRQLSEICGIMPRASEPIVYARCILMPATQGAQ
jgi:hypothetical protein